MSNFICKVLTPQGQIVKIKMNEQDKITCLKKLKKNGMTPISVENRTEITLSKAPTTSAKIYSKRKKKFNFNLNKEVVFSDKVKTEELIKFTKDFYLLKKSNFTNKHALLTLVNNSTNPKFKEILHKMINNLDNGINMYKTMREYPDVFPFVYRNIIKTGELNGLFEEALSHAITFLEDEENLKSNIERVIIPQVAMFFGIITMIFLAVLIGIPLLEDIFISSGSKEMMPLGIKVLYSIFSFIIKYWYLVALVIVLFVAGFSLFIKTQEGKEKFDNFKYNNFLFGKLTFLLDFSRLIRCLDISVKNKMRFQDALEVSKNVVDNTHMLNLIESSINNIYIGKSWITPFESDNNLNSIILEILKKESEHNLEKTFEKVIEYIDVSIEKELKRVMKLLPQITYSIIGIILFLFLIIILIPSIRVYLGGFLFV